MYIGYIVNDVHPCLKTISEKEISLYTRTMPILIVGYAKAVELYPKTSLTNKIINKEQGIFYAFSKEESEQKYQENLDNFISHCFQEITEPKKVINIISLSEIKPTFKEAFIHETPIAITITTSKEIFYLNKEITSFFNTSIVDIDAIVTLLKGIKIISWDRYEYFGAYLKAAHCYKSKEQVTVLFSTYGNIDLYMGTLCLNMLAQLARDKNLIEIWQRAYIVENTLSAIKVKVDEVKVESLITEDNPVMQNIFNAIDDGYIVQKYNGTNKITGRIFPYGTGFSLQTLSNPIRDIIIAEEGCVLVEFDYKAFEYSILSQLCEMNMVGDPHLFMSQLLFGDNEHRDIGKNLNYSLLYGKSISHILENVLIHTDLKISAEELKNKLTTILTPVQELQKRLEKELKENGYFENYFGRRIYPEKSWACINNYFQSTAAEIFIIKLHKLFQLLSKYNPINRIVLQSHDSVLLNLSLQTIEDTDIAAEIKTLLEEPENGITNQVHIKYGVNWRNLT